MDAAIAERLLAQVRAADGYKQQEAEPGEPTITLERRTHQGAGRELEEEVTIINKEFICVV